ncbi:2-succinyl-6-hydroxy-2,4-cyclohexadiene-1-carboxylate synthase [Sporolactobacillus nakayamae]|uniref:Putative 2-succinyl-6-hydroxy-2,4-cyclohexadiene-1-carboxylate synthase n=1 Tax=Sporolactobacillus nakayamae TaxID=269670 RepID=A0A1I2N1X8_9BACL|nr:2-succinyl-6-hydroxy-2,4-cyclohexadiene-1-carboxylate synthase [Sporolactobacillus nakayamae]SFF97885.1 2-succinyl-6-hydroxy-2,4-cyclohexadiene-1-carboxylate synthase [Sporolactobacillus nakayamae]
MKAELRGVTYHYERRGTGEPLLFLHGFTGSMKTWHFLEARFVRDYQLIFVDIIGHGHSESPKDFRRYAINEVAKDLTALLDLLNIDKVHLIGYSMGGRLALTFACLFPERIASLILESSSPGLKTEAERMARRLRDQKLAESICEDGIPAFVNRWENLELFDSQKCLPESSRSALREQRLANLSNGLSNSLIGMGTGAQPSWWKHLATLQVPVLLITGALDAKFCKIASELCDRLPDADWQAVPDAGHAVHLEQPSDYQERIHTFIQCQALRLREENIK